MTSEVENVMRAQIVAKTSDLKQIAVSTTNLTPDASGIAPLEKQGAFEGNKNEKMSQANTPELTSNDNSNLQMPINQPVEPVSMPQMPMQEPVLNNQVNNVSENPLSVDTPSVNMQQQPTMTQTPINDNLESIDYNKPTDSGILTESPVDVVGATGLDQMNVSGFVDKSLEGLNELIKEEKSAPEPQLQKMEMPIMDQQINAQEPVGQDNRLFEGVQINSPQVNNPNPPLGDTPFAIPTSNGNEINSFENVQPLSNPMIQNEESLNNSSVIENQQMSEVTPANITSNQEEPVLNTEQPVNTPISDTQVNSIQETPLIKNDFSAFDDHLKMPDELAKELNLPTMENTIQGENVPSSDLPDINQVDNSNMEMSNAETIDIERALEPVFNRFKDELIFTIKSMNSAVNMNKSEPVIEPENLGNPSLQNPIEISQNPEIGPESLEIPNNAPEVGINNITPEMMNIDEEPVHGKFI